MTLANTFYVVGIICMTLNTFFFIAIIFLLFYIWKKVSDIQNKIEDRLEDLHVMLRHPKETASDIGSAAASGIIESVANMLRKKKS